MSVMAETSEAFAGRSLMVWVAVGMEVLVVAVVLEEADGLAAWCVKGFWVGMSKARALVRK